jgi:mono/diheme cytochrome c family protein
MRSLCFLLTTSAVAAPVDFVRDVRPIFETHCYECHGEKKQKSGLRLDIKSEAFKGGDNHAPDIIAKNAKDSPLIHFITTDDEDELMPPKGKLSAGEIATLTAWINEGAPWPDGVDLARLEDRRDHWSFKPLTKSMSSSIDGFIEAKLKEIGLTKSPETDPVSWLRRVTFDLTGLPPTPEEVTAFLKNPDHAALVDRLLASPRYGERWAQHWLDVVRYADTHGFEVNTERPNAWPYRDYVIHAFSNSLAMRWARMPPPVFSSPRPFCYPVRSARTISPSASRGRIPSTRSS